MQNQRRASFHLRLLATPKPYTSLAPMTTTMVTAASRLLLRRRLAYSPRLSFPGRGGGLRSGGGLSLGGCSAPHPCGIPLPPGGHHLPGSGARFPLPPPGGLGSASLPPPPSGIVFRSPAATLRSGGRLSLPADVDCCAWAARHPCGIPHLPGVRSGACLPLSGPVGLGSPGRPLCGPGSIAFSASAPPLPVRRVSMIPDGDGGGRFYFDTEVVGFKEITFKWALVFQIVIMFVGITALYWQISNRAVIPDIMRSIDSDVIVMDRHFQMFYDVFLAYCKNQRKRHKQMVKLFKGEEDADDDEEIEEDKVGRQPAPLPMLPEVQEDHGEDEEEDDLMLKCLLFFGLS